MTYENLSETTETSSYKPPFSCVFRGPEIPDPIFTRLSDFNEELAPLPLRPPQIPHDLTWDRTRAAAMNGR
jgi:hypothetical protein